MYCQKCGSVINNGENFCKSCGSPVIKENGNQTKTTNVSKDELLKIYIGNNADKFKPRGFSLPCFFFGIPYLFYRKMYLFGFVHMLILILSSSLNSAIPWMNYTLNIIVSCLFYNLYLRKADKDIDNILKTSSNFDNENIKNKVRKKGGISVIALILTIVIFSIIFFSAFFYLTYVTEIDETETTTTNSEYLSYNIPDNFTTLSEYSYYNSYSYKNPETELTDCDFNISILKNNDGYIQSSTIYLENYLSLSANERDNILTQNINNKTWAYTTTHGYSTKYYYTLVTQNAKYLYEFTLYDETSEYCKVSNENIVNTFNIVIDSKEETI